MFDLVLLLDDLSFALFEGEESDSDSEPESESLPESLEPELSELLLTAVFLSLLLRDCMSSILSASVRMVSVVSAQIQRQHQLS